MSKQHDETRKCVACKAVKRLRGNYYGQRRLSKRLGLRQYIRPMCRECLSARSLARYYQRKAAV